MKARNSGLLPFSDSPIVKKKTWAYSCTEAEEEEANTLFASVTKLVRERGKELSGTLVYSLFLKRRIQPCQHRAHPMWQYAETSDSTRCSREVIPDAQLAIMARRLSKIADDATFDMEPSVEPYSLKKPLPEVISKSLNIFKSFRMRVCLPF